MDAKTIRDKHEQFLFPCVANYYGEPLVIERAAGSTVHTADGKDYLDFFGGILTVSLAHCHPSINEKVIAQIGKLQHTSTLYPTEPMVNLAETLSRITPGKLNKCFFTNSGTEADETAVVLAQLATGNQELIALRHGYSGRSILAQSLTAHGPWRAIPTAISFIKHAHSPYCYRCAMGLSYPACDMRCARDIKELIETETTGNIAGMLAEPIQGVGGFVVAPPEYFEVAVPIIREHGGILIADEVQTGFGRSGGKMWGIEHYGVEPEIMTMAKGVANGFPMGITVATDEVAAAFKALTISTFGGNPVSCTAAQATIDLMEQEKIPQRSDELGARLRDGLEALAREHQLIGEVRGRGMMQAIELVQDRKTKEPAPARAAALMEQTKALGLLVGKGGLYGNVLRIAPPMLISPADLDRGLELLGRALAAC
jgi:alanine-glyoxylate transaminase / (R)-3-amino-2-methylpropionate-pyruvate transaminase